MSLTIGLDGSWCEEREESRVFLNEGGRDGV